MIKAVQMPLDSDALIQLGVQHDLLPELGLADQEDIDEEAVFELDIENEPQFFEYLRIINDLRLIDDQEIHLPLAYVVVVELGQIAKDLYSRAILGLATELVCNLA
ncbi:MAG: hypothetical protein P8Y91_06575, partial [Desulfuromonadales bacterium]